MLQIPVFSRLLEKMYPLSVTFVAVSVVLPLLALLAILARQQARRIKSASYNSSDYTIVVAWVILSATNPFFD